MGNGNGIDPKFFNQVAQFAHFGMMYSINLTLAFPFFLVHKPLGAIAVLVLCVGYAAWHEFIHDPDKENAATRGSDAEDFLFLSMGILAGQSVALLFSHLLK